MLIRCDYDFPSTFPQYWGHVFLIWHHNCYFIACASYLIGHG